jgi:hypothetical protein
VAARDDVSMVRLIGKLLAQWLAASYLTFPAVLYWVWQHAPEQLVHNQFLQVNACLAPATAVWVVLRHRRVRLNAWWVVGRATALLILASVVTWQALDLTRMGVREIDPLRSGVVLVFLWVWIIAWRQADRRWLGAPPPARRGVIWQGESTKPQRGEIWSAKVPFEASSYTDDGPSAKDRPCVVISTFARHAYVLKITSVDKSNRPGYLHMPAGWHPWSEKESWLQLSPLLKVPYLDFRQHIRDTPDILWPTLANRYPATATPQQHVPTKCHPTPTRAKQRARH